MGLARVHTLKVRDGRVAEAAEELVGQKMRGARLLHPAILGLGPPARFRSLRWEFARSNRAAISAERRHTRRNFRLNDWSRTTPVPRSESATAADQNSVAGLPGGEWRTTCIRVRRKKRRAASPSLFLLMSVGYLWTEAAKRGRERAWDACRSQVAVPTLAHESSLRSRAEPSRLRS